MWALRDYGFRALIAPSFADILRANCFKNGLLPIVLGDADVERPDALRAVAPAGCDSISARNILLRRLER